MIWLSRIISGQAARRSVVGAAAVTACIVVCVPIKNAAAIDKIYSPIVHEGEVELETRGTYNLDHRDDKDNAYQQKFSVGYGLTDRYAFEILGEIEHEPNEDTEFEAVELENLYQLFEQGEYWLDAGLYFAAEWKPEDNEYGIEARILLEKATGKLVHTTNILFEREVLEDSDDGNTPEEGGLSWVTRYQLQPELEPGVELHLEIEDLDNAYHLNDETLSIGPSLWGAITPRVKYEVAGLFGTTEEAPDFVARFLLQYEFAA